MGAEIQKTSQKAFEIKKVGFVAVLLFGMILRDDPAVSHTDCKNLGQCQQK